MLVTVSVEKKYCYGRVSAEILATLEFDTCNKYQAGPETDKTERIRQKGN